MNHISKLSGGIKALTEGLINFNAYIRKKVKIVKLPPNWKSEWNV
jgi:hypothetical protein